MKERFWSLILVFIFFGISQNVISKSINIQKVWVTSDNKGYTIHSKFDIIGMKGKKIQVIATFYDCNKKAMKMVRQEYRNANNGVAISSFTTPSLEKTTYNNYQLFIPSDALRLGYGLNTHYVNISVYDQTEKSFIGTPSSFTAFYSYIKRPESQIQLSKNNTTSSTDSKRRGFPLRDFLKSSETNKRGTTKVAPSSTSLAFKSSNAQARPNKVVKAFYYTETGEKTYYTFEGNKCYLSDASGNLWKNTGIYFYKNSNSGYRNYVISFNKTGNKLFDYMWEMISVNEDYSRLLIYSNTTKLTFEYLNKVDKSKIKPQQMPIYVPSQYSVPVYQHGNSGTTGYDSNNIACGICKGSGRCTLCAGKGWKRLDENSPQVDCPDCLGGGQCRWCFGTGKYKDPVYVPVR